MLLLLQKHGYVSLIMIYLTLMDIIKNLILELKELAVVYHSSSESTSTINIGWVYQFLYTHGKKLLCIHITREN